MSILNSIIFILFGFILVNGVYTISSSPNPSIYSQSFLDTGSNPKSIYNCDNATSCMKCVESLKCIWCNGKCIPGSQPCFGLYWGSCGMPVVGVLAVVLFICCLCCLLGCICWYFRRVCCRSCWSKEKNSHPEMLTLIDSSDRHRRSDAAQRAHELGERINAKHGIGHKGYKDTRRNADSVWEE